MKKIKISVVFLVVLFAGCMSEANRNNRCDANQPLGSRLAKSAYKALVNPRTYIPAFGAMVVAAGGWDDNISDWASERTPIFSSQSTARDLSNNLLPPMIAGVAVTALASPVENNDRNWTINKATVLGVQAAAFGTSVLAESTLKELTDRTRPDYSDDRSFPSGHSTMAFSAATLSNRNLDLTNIPDNLRSGLQAGNIILASTVAWARVEAGSHYPSDVLAGAALGHFFSSWIYDAFMNQPGLENVGLLISPYERGVAVSITIRY
jgi:membrane-associated phospholipid phosphatase